jgi:hypothetical protein
MFVFYFYFSFSCKISPLSLHVAVYSAEQKEKEARIDLIWNVSAKWLDNFEIQFNLIEYADDMGTVRSMTSFCKAYTILNILEI